MSSSDSEEDQTFSLFSSIPKTEMANETTSKNGESEQKTVVEKKIAENNFMRTFEDLGLNEWIIKSADEVGIRKPTPVQKNCIPSILEGKNVIGIAETGSGKTAAFALPILQNLAIDPYGIYAIVVTPTRELAFQIKEQFDAFGRGILIRTCLLVGGQNQLLQSVQLEKRPHIIIATPGRLLEHMSTGDGLPIKKMRYMVLDEADRLLSGSQKEELEQILSKITSNPQYILMTATYNKVIKELKYIQNAPLYVYEGNIDTHTVSTLDEYYLLIPQQIKLVYMVYIMMHSLKKVTEEDEEPEEEDKLSLYNSKSIIIFCNKCRTVQILHEVLQKFDIETVTLHSVLNQRRRLAALGKFKNQFVRVLICTDVASRGLDIPQVDMVINYDLPANPHDYVHRVGRTARAGRSGVSLSLVTQYDVTLLKNIEKTIGKQMTEQQGIKEDDVLLMLGKVTKAERVAMMRLTQDGFTEKYQQIRSERKARDEKKRKPKTPMHAI